MHMDTITGSEDNSAFHLAARNGALGVVMYFVQRLKDEHRFEDLVQEAKHVEENEIANQKVVDCLYTVAVAPIGSSSFARQRRTHKLGPGTCWV